MSMTETMQARYQGLDAWDDDAILAAFTEGQERAVAALHGARGPIAAAATAIATRTGDVGRIIYAGAGSSGLIAALDGMELGGTFGWPDERIAFVLANGRTLQPGMAGIAEDDAVRGRADMAALAPGPADVVIAVTASGTTAFTRAAAAAARAAGALVIGIANNQGSPLLHEADIPIFLDSGPEIIGGSTRMNAGTAQKAALGLISSLAMIRLGHVHDGQMVNLRIDNAKLRKRAVTMLVHITGRSESEAAAALDRSGDRVKTAALVLSGLAPAEADRVLAAAKGNLRTALARLD